MRTQSHTPDAMPRRPARRPRCPRHVISGAVAGALLLVLGLFALSAGAAAGPTTVTMVGRGWGHGIGMSQWGAYGFAKNGATYEEILTHYYTGIELGRVDNAPIRVRLRGGVRSVKLTCANTYDATGGGEQLRIPGGTTATVSWADGTYRVTAGSLTKSFGAPVVFTPSAGQLRTVTPDDWGKTGTYRGTIRVLHTSTGFTVINRLPLESYLRGVVPHEMPASWPAEALKAQACAARSYAERARKPGQAFDVYCTTRDQAYGGVRSETAATNAAVRATAGVVPTYDGAPIAAFYFSTSGGHTENIENVWQTSPVPYLKGVPDPYDTFSPLHLWPENPIRHPDTWYEDRLGAYSAANPTGVKGTLRTVVVLERGASPRVVKAALVGSGGVTVVSGAALRFKLALRDTWVRFTSMSLVADATTVTCGDSVHLRGRIYPALKDGATVTLRYYRDGSWKSLTVPTTRGARDLGSGLTAAYSAYSYLAKPKQATTYQYVSGTARSPQVRIAVRPAVTIEASATSVTAGTVVTFTGTTTPPLRGATAWLQTKDTDGWKNVASVTLGDGGAYSFEWAAVAGVTAARVRVPPTAGLLAGVSPVVALTVGS